jgi:hypothetical protein
MTPNQTQKAGEYLRTLVHGALRRLGLALASDLETECERGRFMEKTLTTYSACIDRLTDENKTLRAQNMNLVRDAVALKLDPLPQGGGVSDRVREALGRLREDRAKFRADLDRRLEQTRQMAAVAMREPPPPFGPTPIVHPRQNGGHPLRTDTVPLSGHVLASDIPLNVPVISTKGYDTSGKGDYTLQGSNGRTGIDPASFGGGARAPDAWPPAFFADTPFPASFNPAPDAADCAAAAEEALAEEIMDSGYVCPLPPHPDWINPAPDEAAPLIVQSDPFSDRRSRRKRKPAIKPDSDDDAA